MTEILVPYFIEGLKNNEYCMWVTSEPLTKDMAEAAIKQSMPNYERSQIKGQIEVLSYSEWYLKGGEFDLQRVLTGWIEKLDWALEHGYDGLRVSGNTAWLEKKDWIDFKEYEREINTIIGDYRMLAICTYSLDKCNAQEIIDIVVNHQFAIIKRKGKWQMLENSDRKHNLQKLEESEEKFRNVMESSPNSIVLLDLKGTIIDCNQETTANLGKKKEEIVGNSYLELIKQNNNDPSKALESFQKLITNKKLELVEFDYFNSNGEKIWTENRISLFNIGDQQLIQVVSQDITERKKAEQKLKESEKRYKRLFKTSRDAIMTLEPSGWNFTSGNPATLKMFGVKDEDDFCSRAPWQYFPEHQSDGKPSKSKAKEMIDCAMEEGKNFFEWTHKRLNGAEFPATVLLSRMEIGDKQFLQATVRDITEQKRAEKKLFESEQRFRTLFDNSPFIISLLDKTGKVVDMNNFEELGGYVREDLIGTHFSELGIVPKESISQIASVFKNLLKNGRSEPMEVQLNRKEGGLMWARIQSTVVELSDERLYQIITQDIDAVKGAQEKLRESEKKYRELVELLPDIIFETNENLDLNYVNKVGFEKFGYSREDFNAGINIFDTIAPEEKEKASENFKRIIKGEIKGSRDYVLKRKDGSTFYGIIHSSPMIESGSFKGLRGIITDITNRKESQMKYSTILKTALDGFWIHNSDARFLEVNASYCEMIGYSREELLSMSIPDIEGVEKPEETIQHAKKIMEQGYDRFETRHRCKDGRIIDIEVSSNYLNVEGGQFVVFIRNMTEYKKAEQKLKESEEKYRSLVESTSDWIWQVDEEGIYKYASPRVFDLLGYEPEEIIGKTPFDLMPPEEVKRVGQIFGKIIESQEPFSGLVNENIHKDGHRVILETSGVLAFNSDGVFIGYRGVDRDITERKLAEQKLKESEEKFKSLYKGVPVPTYMWQKVDGDFVLEDFNTAAEELAPNEMKKLLGVKASDWHKDRPDIIEMMEECFNEKKIISKEVNYYYQTTDQERTLSVKVGYIYPDLILVHTDDITEKKVYEDLIYELNIDFLNFSPDFQSNIISLLKSTKKMANAELVLFVRKSAQKETEFFKVITSDNQAYTFEAEDFTKNYLFHELFDVNQDVIQTFLNIHQTPYARSDQFVETSKAIGGYGRLIKLGDDFDGAICVLKRNNPAITHHEQLTLHLISDALIVEVKRWQTQQNLEKQYQRLKELNQIKSDLLNRTSHELKTPLVAIKGNAELLSSLYIDQLDSDAVEIISEIKRGSDRLELLVSDILKSSRLESGRVQLKTATEDLTFLIKYCVKELKHMADIRNQEIEINITEGLKAEFEKERIYDVVNNLLTNAIKYTPPTGKILITSQFKDGEIVISIEDNGIGFTEEEKKQTFTQFGKIERYGQGWDVGIEGTGLGLYIAKKIVELHNGKIWLESEGRNKGSKFYFSLPKTQKPKIPDNAKGT